MIGNRIVLGIAFLAVSFVDSPAATINVPEDQPTIQAAVDAANPGDKIRIAPGIYNENVVVDVDGVSLVARDGVNTVVVDGTGLVGQGSGVDGIHVIADRVGAARPGRPKLCYVCRAGHSGFPRGHSGGER